MLALLLALVAVWLVLAVVGLAVKGLAWLTLVALLGCAATAAYAYARRDR